MVKTDIYHSANYSYRVIGRSHNVAMNYIKHRETYRYANRNKIISTQIHTQKYIEHVRSKPITTSMRVNIDGQICERPHNNVYTNKNKVAIEFSRRRKHEHSTSTTFVRLPMWDYKRAK